MTDPRESQNTQSCETPTPSTRRDPASRRSCTTLVVIVGTLLVVLCACLGFCFLLATVGGAAATAQKYGLEDVIDAHMRAMARKDLDRALDLFCSDAPPETRSELQTMLDEPNYALFDGYTGIESTDFSIGPWITTVPGASRAIVARVSGIVSYGGTGTGGPHRRYRGDFRAVLVRENGQWRLYSIAVTVPPQKIEDYSASRPCPAPPSGWHVLLSDNFVNNSHRWDTGRSSNELGATGWSIERGKLRAEASALQPFVVHSRPIVAAVTDFYLTVETRQLSGPEESTRGVVFRITHDDWYYFAISDVQESGVWLQNDDTWTTLIDWRSTPSIRPGEVNAIAVLASGSRFSLCVNDTLVGEFDDASLSRGVVGLMVELESAGDQAVFEFDRFRVLVP